MLTHECYFCTFCVWLDWGPDRAFSGRSASTFWSPVRICHRNPFPRPALQIVSVVSCLKLMVPLRPWFDRKAGSEFGSSSLIASLFFCVLIIQRGSWTSGCCRGFEHPIGSPVVPCPFIFFFLRIIQRGSWTGGCCRGFGHPIGSPVGCPKPFFFLVIDRWVRQGFWAPNWVPSCPLPFFFFFFFIHPKGIMDKWVLQGFWAPNWVPIWVPQFFFFVIDRWVRQGFWVPNWVPSCPLPFLILFFV